jgi:hypothetical protein
MPMSQIDMVIFEQDDSHLQVCGDFAPAIVDPAKPAEIHVAVRQGDVVARGSGQCDGANWEVDAEAQGQLTPGSAIACAVAIVEKEPAGLETLVWVQEVEIRHGKRVGVNVPLDFPEPESVISASGQLAGGRTVASSLAISKEENPQGGRTLSWHREVSIRPVVAAEVEPVDAVGSSSSG